MSKDRIETRAELVIYGYEPVANLADILGLEPDQTAPKGGRNGSTGPPLKRSFWSVTSALPLKASAEEHIESLLEVIRPRKRALQAVAQGYETKIAVNLNCYGNEFNPEIELDPSILAEMAELHVKLWLDIYVFGD